MFARRERDSEQSDVLPAQATGERVATSAASHFRPYCSRRAASADVTTWVQIDLGSHRQFDAIRLLPFSRPHAPPADYFPLRFRIECSNDAQFATCEVIADQTHCDYPDPGDRVLEFKTESTAARYVRLTATRLRAKKKNDLYLCVLHESRHQSYLDLIRGYYALALTKLEVIAGGMDIAVRRPVTVDAAYGNPEDAQQLTRPPRPSGEGVVTDNPENVTPPDTWRPVPYAAQTPLAGVQLKPGLFLTAIERNIQYLLESFTAEDLLHDFRRRAGKPVAPLSRKTRMTELWIDDLAGSNAGRFLMGAANSLRWLPNPELRARVDAVVAGIAECRQDNGYIMAYPEDTIFHSERGAYTRAWLTHGLIEAGRSGNALAFDLLRSYYDWYNRMPRLPHVLRACGFGAQGSVANTRVYFTPVGKPDDLQVVQRYLQENYWLEELAARRPEALWQYPYDRPHCYTITFLEPYLDLYRATGERRYLDAVLGGWELIRDNWQAIGGSITLREFEDTPPRATLLYERVSGGETCGSAFWIALNQRLHLLFPGEEKYVAEIEKSLYNVLLANQADGKGIRYVTPLMGRKAVPACDNTCCEGQGTRILGSLAEYVYSVTNDGLYVNLFEPAGIHWRQDGEDLHLDMDTAFPNSPQVRLTLRSVRSIRSRIRIRTPGWAAGTMSIRVNGAQVATGMPGSYATLERTWSNGDVIEFSLPIALRFTRYIGADQVEGRARFGLEYGPLLMAAVNVSDTEVKMEDGCKSVAELTSRLRSMPDQPLHFSSPQDYSNWTWIPYFAITNESFSCLPMISFGRRYL